MTEPSTCRSLLLLSCTVAALICLAGPVVSAASAPQENLTIVLAAGPRQGVHYRLAERMQDRLAEGGYRVRIDPKPDCAESLAWLEEEPEKEEIRFAFAQQDIVGERFRTTNTPVRVVARSAHDYLHLLVRRNLSIRALPDLAGRRVWLGEEGSAARFTAEHFLESAGVRLDNKLTFEKIEGFSWSREDLSVEDRAVQELSNWLHGEKLDAALLVAPAGSTEVLDVLRRAGCRLLSLSPPVRRALLHDPTNDWFLRHMAIGSFPATTYENQAERVSVLAIPVLLLAREGTNPDLAERVGEAAREAVESLRWEKSSSSSPVIRLPEPKPLANPGLKWLEGVANPDQVTPRSLLPSIPGLVAAAGIACWQWRRIRRWARRLRRTRRVAAAFSTWHQFSRVLTTSVLVIVVCMVGITVPSWLIEREVNESFSTFWESWWSITLYIFSGLDQARAPYTALGRLLGSTGRAIGWLLSIGVTSTTIAILIRRDRKMPPRLKDHLLLLNWNERGMDILRQLHHPDLNDHERTSVTLVLSDDPDMKLPLFSSFPEVYPKIGDPTSEADLGKVNAHLARTVVILADEKRGDEGAIRSILKLRNAIAKNTEEAGDRDVHVIVELIDPANGSIIEDLAKSYPGHLEAISDRQLRTCVVAQAALIEGIAGFYVDLLSVGGGENNEIYAVDIPVSAIGLSFRQYSAKVLERSTADNPVIPIGIHRKTDKRYEVITNPAGRCDLVAGDRLLVIAYKPPGEGALPPLEAPTPQPVVAPEGGLSLQPEQ